MGPLVEHFYGEPKPWALNYIFRFEFRALSKQQKENLHEVNELNVWRFS